MKQTESVDAVVVGGANLDIGGFAGGKLRAGESHPGAVRLSLGGVGRNIAHNLSRLGLRVSLVTALGGDPFAARIEASCAALGIDLSLSPRFAEERSSSYLFISDPKGDMALAVSDMDIYRRLTPALLSGRLEALNGARALVLDANLPAETIVWLCERASVPLYADPVSAVKAEKLRAVLGRLRAIKPNRQEAELLSGVRITDERSLHRAADALLGTGLREVYITLGPEGLLAADHKSRLRLPAAGGPIVNTTGCGDAFAAALVWAKLQGMSLEQTARAGLAAAKLTMAAEETVNPKLSAEAIGDAALGGPAR